MNIVTGYTGVPHISPMDDKMLNAGIFGTEYYVLNTGNKLSYRIDDVNTITIKDGDLMAQGTLARINYGDTESVNIENGTTGYNRIDLIVAVYKNVAGVESVNLGVIKGTSTTGTALEPNYQKGNVLTGDITVEYPLYAVTLSGVNIVSVKKLFDVITGLDDRYTIQQVDEIVKNTILLCNKTMMDTFNKEVLARTKAVNDEAEERKKQDGIIENNYKMAMKQEENNRQQEYLNVNNKIEKAKAALNNTVTCINSIRNGFNRIGGSSSWEELTARCANTCNFIDEKILELKTIISKI